MYIVHAADLHLDSPLRGLEQYDSAPVGEAREASRQAFRNLVELCLERQAALLLLAGDLFDSDWRDFNTGLFFLDELARLQEVGARVVLLRGNHDSASEVTRALTLPEHVAEVSSRSVQSMRFEDLGVVVHGRSYPQRSVFENWVPGYPAATPGLVNIGLLHTNVDGRPEHDNYAPCSLGELVDKGYSYWALGHVHQGCVLHEEPAVVYPGCLQGRHGRETGPKGCAVLEVDDGRVAGLEQVTLSAMEWARLEVRLSGHEEEADDVLAAVDAGLSQLAADGGCLLAVRVEVSGACPGYVKVEGQRERLVNEVRALASRLRRPAWIEKVRLGVQAPERRSPGGAAANLHEQLRERIRALSGAPQELQRLAGHLAPLWRKAGHDLDEDLRRPEVMAQLLEDVQVALDAKLTGAEP
jgi:DNA repair protein SbcD/Mre11